MTYARRLFWEDPYQVAFDAAIIESCEHEGKPSVRLDATAFYPTSGGQPNDIGTLNGVAVLDVVEEGQSILHVLAEPLGDKQVHGQVDWDRRLDHMQQHTGQHILSQAFVQVLGAETVSFHLGRETCTIDLAIDSLDIQQAAMVEDLANRVVMGNRLVTVREFSPADLAALALRKAPDVEDDIRVVNIADFDVCACCGTHLRVTGEVGSIHVRRWEKRRRQVRVEFVCGQRVVADHRLVGAVCQRLATQLSVSPIEVPDAVERLRVAEKASRRRMEALRKRLLTHEIVDLAAQTERVGGLHVLCRVLDDYDTGNMRYVAQNLIQKPDTVVLLGVTDPSPQLCFARAENVEMNMGALLRETAKPFGGRGGGRPHMAQGGGMSANDLEACLRAARQRLLESRV